MSLRGVIREGWRHHRHAHDHHPLAACSKGALDKLAEKPHDLGKARANTIEAADVNVSTTSQQRRDALLANQAAAVR